MFEEAMGSNLNKNKTKLYTIGNWINRNQWPLDWLQVKNYYFCTLGIYHSTNFNKSVFKNWEATIEKITIHSRIILNRKLSLHQ